VQVFPDPAWSDAEEEPELGTGGPLQASCLAPDPAAQGYDAFAFTEEDSGIKKFVPLPRITQPFRQRSKVQVRIINCPVQYN
jgi:hypothetical protein